jgi:hypothetical protein
MSVHGTFIASALLTHSLPSHFLLTSHILSLTFLQDPAPSLIVPPNSHMGFRLCDAHYDSFAALKLTLSAFHSYVCTSGGSLGIDWIGTFQRAKNTPIQNIECCDARLAQDVETQHKHVAKTKINSRNSSVYPTCHMARYVPNGAVLTIGPFSPLHGALPPNLDAPPHPILKYRSLAF